MLPCYQANTEWHFYDCSMCFAHYHPDRPYDHFIDHSQLPGKHARELPVRRVAYSFWQYRSLSIARYPLHLGGVAGQRCHAQDSNPRPLDLESGTLCTTPHMCSRCSPARLWHRHDLLVQTVQPHIQTHKTKSSCCTVKVSTLESYLRCGISYSNFRVGVWGRIASASAWALVIFCC